MPLAERSAGRYTITEGCRFVVSTTILARSRYVSRHAGSLEGLPPRRRDSPDKEESIAAPRDTYTPSESHSDNVSSVTYPAEKRRALQPPACSSHILLVRDIGSDIRPPQGAGDSVDAELAAGVLLRPEAYRQREELGVAACDTVAYFQAVHRRPLVAHSVEASILAARRTVSTPYMPSSTSL